MENIIRIYIVGIILNNTSIGKVLDIQHHHIYILTQYYSYYIIPRCHLKFLILYVNQLCFYLSLSQDQLRNYITLHRFILPGKIYKGLIIYHVMLFIRPLFHGDIYVFLCIQFCSHLRMHINNSYLIWSIIEKHCIY